MIQVIYKTSSISADITDSIESMTWSGTLEQSVRQLSLEYVSLPTHDLELELGDEISLSYNSNLLFLGRLFSIDETRENGKFQLVFMDMATVLNTVPLTLKLKSANAASALKEMCNKLNLDIGSVAPSKNHKTITCSKKTGRWLIDKVYETDKPALYPMVYPLFYNNKLSILETGKTKTEHKIVEGENVISSHYSKNSDKVINQVRIVSFTGKTKKVLEDKDSMKRLGTFSHSLITDSIDYVKEGKKLLNKPLSSLSITVTGKADFISGASTIVSDITGQVEKEFIILSDRHMFTPSGYKTELKLMESGVTKNG
jgi:hypothetical protein